MEVTQCRATLCHISIWGLLDMEIAYGNEKLIRPNPDTGTTTAWNTQRLIKFTSNLNSISQIGVRSSVIKGLDQLTAGAIS